MPSCRASKASGGCASERCCNPVRGLAPSRRNVGHAVPTTGVARARRPRCRRSTVASPASRVARTVRDRGVPTADANAMKLLPLDRPELIELVAGWLGREENHKWLDFGNGFHTLTPVSLKVMTQRDLHVLRAFTPDDSDLP